MVEWDASRYHRLSDPQVAWGRRVFARLSPQSGERILDLGCGTGRLTAEIAAAARGMFVVGLDRSAAMLGVAAGNGTSYRRVRGDGSALPFVESFDAVFSNATLHWITDHQTTFSEVHRVLVPGGRFVAQCGGIGNLRVLLERTRDLMESPRYAGYFQGWRDVWEFADPGGTRDRLTRAGFISADVWLEPAPTSLPDADTYADFISCVCIRHHLERLPPDDRPGFVAALTSRAVADDPPFTLDYRRLNISACKAPDGASTRGCPR
jgi:trans-aconitate 2-methyltransferase